MSHTSYPAMIAAAIELSEPAAEDAILSANRLRKSPPGTRDRSSPPPRANPEVFTIEEFCAWARISRTQTFKEIWAKRLIARRVGSKSLITLDAARAWINSLPTDRVA
jgi:hypothetical protein